MMPINPVGGVGGSPPPDSLQNLGEVGSAVDHQKLEKTEEPSDDSGVIDLTSPTSQAAEAWRKDHQVTLETTQSGCVVLHLVDPTAGIEVAEKEQEKVEGIERLGDAAQESWIEDEQVRAVTTVTPVKEPAESQAISDQKVPDPPDPATKRRLRL
ncbi:MAG: hypothetical protein ACYCRD_04760 [Leptospirillum sp.]